MTPGPCAHGSRLSSTRTGSACPLAVRMDCIPNLTHYPERDLLDLTGS